MTGYKKVNEAKHPHKDKLKKLNKSVWARAELDKELKKQNPSWQAILIAELMQTLGMR